MQKTILITGATDGIGLETAKLLVDRGHHLLVHGRNPVKLQQVQETLSALATAGGHNNRVETYRADLSVLTDVAALVKEITDAQPQLDILINNAGVLQSAETITRDGLDIRFAVNTLAPYLLTEQLLPLMPSSGRVINLSSAAQAPVNLQALSGQVSLAPMEAYAQSKLALTMWSRWLALKLKDQGPAIIAVNPGSLLGTKMVKEGFGIAGSDIRIGADIVVRASLDADFATASGQYFDNDAKQFADPHLDALDPQKCETLVRAIEALLADKAFTIK